MVATIVLIVVVLLVLVTIFRAIRIIPQQRVAIVERLGKYQATLHAGVNIMIPYIDRIVRLIDFRTQQVVVPPQMVITKDNVQIQIDTVFFYTVIEPKMATYNIANVVQGIQNITVQTSARWSVIWSSTKRCLAATRSVWPYAWHWTK